MATRDIIVIGASAGGVETLSELVRHLPPDLPASVFVVIHLAPHMPSELASILSRSGQLEAREAKTGEVFEPGHIYVAPPDRHLMLENSTMHLWRGPKENRHRPAINVLFRSAAVAYGARVAGVVLSGTLDDGTAGLWWIKRHGGLAIVQNPSEARFPDMIYSALEHVEIDHIVDVAQMGNLLGRVVNGGAPKAREPRSSDRPEILGQPWKKSEL